MMDINQLLCLELGLVCDADHKALFTQGILKRTPMEGHVYPHGPVQFCAFPCWLSHWCQFCVGDCTGLTGLDNGPRWVFVWAKGKECFLVVDSAQ